MFYKMLNRDFIMEADPVVTTSFHNTYTAQDNNANNTNPVVATTAPTSSVLTPMTLMTLDEMFGAPCYDDARVPLPMTTSDQSYPMSMESSTCDSFTDESLDWMYNISSGNNNNNVVQLNNRQTFTVNPTAGRRRCIVAREGRTIEEERRRNRRERNRISAARCRQRRVEITNQLQCETDSLENEQRNLEKEIHKLQQQKDQLEFLLEVHRSSCTLSDIRPPHTSASVRPSTLPILSRTTPLTGIDVSIMTPSLDNIMNTDLDLLSTRGSPLLTPIIVAPSCGDQERKRSSSSSDTSPGNLVM